MIIEGYALKLASHKHDNTMVDLSYTTSCFDTVYYSTNIEAQNISLLHCIKYGMLATHYTVNTVASST